jgi:uncharacterized FlaG/YvyC family protein
MTEASGNLGNTVVPVSSCGATEMRVTNEKKGDRNRNKKREKRHRAIRSIDAIVEDLNQAMHAMNRRIVFSVDGDGAKCIVRMADANSNTIIKEIPAEELQLAERITDLLGVVVDKDG